MVTVRLSQESIERRGEARRASPRAPAPRAPAPRAPAPRLPGRCEGGRYDVGDSTVTSPATEAAEPEQIGQRRRLVIIGALLLGMLLAALDQTIVATALPTIAGDLHGLSHLSWVVTAYLLASTVSTPLWGKLGDLYGRK